MASPGPVRALLLAVLSVVLLVLAPVPLVLGMYPPFAVFVFGVGGLAAAAFGAGAIFQWRSGRTGA